MVRIAFVDDAMPPSSSSAAASSNDAPIGGMAQRLVVARTMRHAAVALQQSAYTAEKAKSASEFDFDFDGETDQELPKAEAAHAAPGGGGGGGGGAGGGVNPIAMPATCAEQMVRIARFRRRGARSRARCYAHARHAPPPPRRIRARSSSFAHRAASYRARRPAQPSTPSRAHISIPSLLPSAHPSD